MANIIPGDGTHGDIPLYNLTYTVTRKEYGYAAKQNRHIEQFDFLYSEPIRLDFSGTYTINVVHLAGPETGDYWAVDDVFWLFPYRGYEDRPQIRMRIETNELSGDDRGFKFILSGLCSAAGATAYSYTKEYSDSDVGDWTSGTWIQHVCDAFPSDWAGLVDGDGTDDVRLALEMQYKAVKSTPITEELKFTGPTVYITRDEFTRAY